MSYTNGIPYVVPTIAAYVAARAKDKVAASRLLFMWLCNDRDRELLYQEMNEQCVALAFESRALRDEDSGAENEEEPKSFSQTAFLLAAQSHVEEAYKYSSSVRDPAQLKYSNSPFQGLGGSFMLSLDEPKFGPGIAECPVFKSHDKQRDYAYDSLQADSLKLHFDSIATIAFKMGALLPLKSRNFDLAQLAENVATRYVALLFGFPQSDLPMLTMTSRKTGIGLEYQMMARHFIADPAAVPESKVAYAQVARRAAELIDLYGSPIGQPQIDHLDDILEEFDKISAYWLENPSGVHAKKLQLLTGSPASTPPIPPFKPLLRAIAQDRSPFSTTEKAVMVAGLVGGAITNIRASICIAIQQFMNLSASDLDQIKTDATNSYAVHRDAAWNCLKSTPFRAHVEEAMRINPPASFLPRKTNVSVDLPKCGKLDANIQSISGYEKSCIPKGSQIVLGVGGGTWVVGDNPNQTGASAKAGAARFVLNRQPSPETRPKTPPPPPARATCPFDHVFGGPPASRVTAPGREGDRDRAEYTHSCFGRDMAMYLITHVVRQIVLLPGLNETLDDKPHKHDPMIRPIDLRKTWGYYCDTYPLEYQKERLLRQHVLQTVLNVKQPVAENAAALKQVIHYGAPIIERVVGDSLQVYFASFLFIENESKLVLFTAFDGDFDSYLGHFAREFGTLFDQFFAHIEGAPPLPISQDPFAFSQFLKLYHRPPVSGYVFSAFPETRVGQIKHQFNNQRKYDWFELRSRP